jgi:hypothetical protein
VQALEALAENPLPVVQSLQEWIPHAVRKNSN